MARREIGVLDCELARKFLAPFAVPVSRLPTGPRIEQLMSPKGRRCSRRLVGGAAGVYGLGKAYWRGGEESEEFNKQLIPDRKLRSASSGGKRNEMWRSLAGNAASRSTTRRSTDLCEVGSEVTGSK